MQINVFSLLHVTLLVSAAAPRVIHAIRDSSPLPLHGHRSKFHHSFGSLGRPSLDVSSSDADVGKGPSATVTFEGAAVLEDGASSGWRRPQFNLGSRSSRMTSVPGEVYLNSQTETISSSSSSSSTETSSSTGCSSNTGVLTAAERARLGRANGDTGFKVPSGHPEKTMTPWQLASGGITRIRTFSRAFTRPRKGVSVDSDSAPDFDDVAAIVRAAGLRGEADDGVEDEDVGEGGGMFQEDGNWTVTADSRTADNDVVRGFASKQAGERECTAVKEARVINVTSVSDFAKRKKYSRTRSVILILQNDIEIEDGDDTLLFDEAYSCTMLLSALPRKLKIAYMGDDKPVLRIWNASNVLVAGVNFYLGVKATSPPCPDIKQIGINVMCPAIHVQRAYGIQLVRGFVFGRIDLARTMFSWVDGMVVTGTGNFTNNPGVIRVYLSGLGRKLVKANVVISNNEAYGVDTPIVAHNGAVGVQIINNYVHDYIFTGIRCGDQMRSQGDCMLTTMGNNFVYSSRGNNLNGDYDNTGLYWNTHWFNPDNRAVCNTVVGGDHCYYLDNSATAVDIQGGACIDTWDGVKVNNGKYNKVKGIVVTNIQRIPSYCSCLFTTEQNCGEGNFGEYWEKLRKKYYNSELIQKLYPFWSNICKATSVFDKACNPKKSDSYTSEETAKCSGIPSHNEVDIVLINGTHREPGYIYCEKVPNIQSFNSLPYVNYTTADIPKLGFFDYKKKRMQLWRWSPIFTARPGFRNCPWRNVGPLNTLARTYFGRFGIPEPRYFQELSEMNTAHFNDMDGYPGEGYPGHDK